MKLKTSNFGETQKSSCDKTQIWMKLKNSNGDETQILLLR